MLRSKQKRSSPCQRGVNGRVTVFMLGLLMLISAVLLVLLKTTSLSFVASATGAAGDSQLIFADGFEAQTAIISQPLTEASVDGLYEYQAVAEADPSLTLSWTLLQAPADMIVDPQTGLVEWLPAIPGDFAVTLRVDDSREGFDEQSYTITVSSNQPPVITSTPVTTAVAGQLYQYDVDAEDPELGDLNYSLAVAPTGMTINATTGLIEWTPAVAGDFPVTVVVRDTGMATATQSFTIVVEQAPNLPPVFNSQPLLTAVVDQAYVYNAEASDPEGGAVSYQLLAGPLGMQANTDNGRVEWLPANPATAIVTIQATDEQGLSAIQNFTVMAEYAATQMLPQITNPGNRILSLGETLIIELEASSPNGAAKFFINPLPLPDGAAFDSLTGRFVFTPLQAGVYDFEFGVGDGRFVDRAAIMITVPAADPATPTSYSGVILDANAMEQGIETPVAGATVRMIGSGVSSITDDSGAFTLTDIDSNQDIIEIDTSTAMPAPNGNSYASFNSTVTFIPNIDNIQERPFYLPRINEGSITTVNPSTETIVTNQALGVEMIIPPGSATNGDGTPYDGEISISRVPNGFAPMNMPDGFNPALLVTVQPTGIRFTSPASISFPNIPDYPPEFGMNLMSLDHDLGRFIVAGKAVVSPNGLNIDIVSGGLPGSSWHGFAPTLEMSENDNPQDCGTGSNNFGSEGCYSDGSLGQVIQLPDYTSLGIVRGLAFSYQSRSTNGSLFVLGEARWDRSQGFRTGAPRFIRSIFKMGGIKISEVELNFDSFPDRIAVGGAGVFPGSSNMGEGGLNLVPPNIGTIPLLAPGTYQGSLTVTSEYELASFSDQIDISVVVPDTTESKYGRGWALLEESRLFIEQGSITLLRPNKKPVIYRLDSISNSYVSPDAEFASLVANPDGYSLTSKIGIVTKFNQQGIQTEVTDRNGNTTSYDYNEQDKLVKIIDPMGLETNLSYFGGKIKQVTDPSGRTTQFFHNNSGDLIKIIFPDGSVRQFNYRGGYMVAQKDESDNQTQYQYDVLGRVIQTTLPDGSSRKLLDKTHSVIPTDGTGVPGNPAPLLEDGGGTTAKLTDTKGNTRSLRLDSHNRPLELTDKLGRVIRHTRNADSLATRTQRADGSVVTRTFDELGNTLSSTEAFNNATTTWAYDAFSQVTSTTDARGNVTTIDRDANGNATRITNALGHITAMEYDQRGLLIRTEDPNGLITEIDYNDQGLPTTITQTAPNGDIRITQNSYDAAGQLLQRIAPDGVTSNMSYDQRGRLISVTDNLGQSQINVYDAASNLLKVEIREADGTVVNRVEHVYDSRNRRIETILPHDSDLATTAIELDGEGNTTGIIDPTSNITLFQYDAVDRLVTEANAEGGVTAYQYDALDNLIRVVAPNGAETTFDVDALSRITAEHSPDRGTLQYSYDQNNNRIQFTDARGIVASYSYDALNRLTAITYPDPAENVTMTYDNCDNGIGRLCQVTDESGQYDYSYDVFGNQLTLDFSPVNITETLTTAYVYDSGDNVVQITYPSGRVINYTRDELRRIIAVDAVINGMPQNIVSNIEYRADGLIIQMTHGNAMITVMDYDLQGRMLDKTLLAQDASTVVDERFYEYDADNNITARTGTPGDHSYSYDAVDRLIEQDITGAENIQYRYDLNGNRLERTIDTGSDTIADLLSYQPDSNRLSEVISTELPNRATESQQSWIYNQANRMAAYLQDGSITTEYIVNSQGQRSHKINPATATQTIYHYSLAGYQILTETTTDASNTTGKDYLWLNGEPIAQIDTSNGTDTISYLHTDHLLTPRLATDTTGLIIWRWEGEAFGDVQPQELAGIEINLRFPGQYHDAESGLHYNMFRDYNPETGRYVQSDPIGLDGGINTYAYVLLNPLGSIDFLGLQSGNNPLPHPACIQGGMTCLCVIAPWACDMEAEDFIETAANAVAENCEIRCSVNCFAIFVRQEAEGIAGEFALKRVAKKTANKLVKDGIAFTLKNVVPVLNVYDRFKNIECVSSCLLTGG